MRTETVRPSAWISHESLASKLDRIKQVKSALQCSLWAAIAIAEGRAEITITETSPRNLEDGR